ncbi:hypothetical protein DYB38_006726 [Aphanomyces astaci]|uniref:MYND-type domain-containing protein n=2 Tax=Aphanomyces astaci TaxID=112090 RepID=A0A397CXF9_APHAT|nr:hypothetical protein DYB38_006726 [Aphanomyces astaci]
MRRGDRCAVCSRQTQVSGQPLLRCSRCHMIRYCGREHQMQHFTTHKTRCCAVKKAVDAAAHAKEDLLAIQGLDIFRVGQFWGMYETRPYMLSLASQIEALEHMGTDSSLRAAIDVLFECLRLNRSDNMGLRDVAPGILLRLGEDQHAYDFVRWWAQDRPTFEWENTSLPYLDTRGADATESVEHANFLSPFGGPSLQHLVALVLVKLRVRDDIEARGCFRLMLAGTLRGSSPLRQLRGHIPALRMIEAFTATRSSATPGPVFGQNEATIATMGQCATRVACLDHQISRLLLHAERRSPRIWKAMVNPISILSVPDPRDCAVGDENDAKKAVERLLPAYRATPRALARLVAYVGSPSSSLYDPVPKPSEYPS